MMTEQHQYESFEATQLFCSHCKEARPVRKHLLLVLPTGNKYDYRCAVCAMSVGSKTDNNTEDFRTFWRG